MDATPLCLFWKCFTVTHHEFIDPQTLRLQLEPDDRIPPVCSGCDHACFLVHDVHRRRVLDAPMLTYWVELNVTVRCRRLRYPVWGPTRERIDWLPGRSPVTTTLRSGWSVWSRCCRFGMSRTWSACQVVWIDEGRSRDGGARLDRRYRLYDTTQDRQLQRYWEETDKAWQ